MIYVYMLSGVLGICGIVSMVMAWKAVIEFHKVKEKEESRCISTRKSAQR